MNAQDRVNILLVDDQPAKLLSYEVILGELNENLIRAASAREALEVLLKNDVAVILVDVCMPELDGFELVKMLRQHPRYEKTAIIFISAVQISDEDRIRGFEMGAVDYVPVPVIPDVLRAKVRIFVELHRKSRQLEQLNDELETRVRERTAAAGGLDRAASRERGTPSPGERGGGVRHLRLSGRCRRSLLVALSEAVRRPRAGRAADRRRRPWSSCIPIIGTWSRSISPAMRRTPIGASSSSS